MTDRGLASASTTLHTLLLFGLSPMLSYYQLSLRRCVHQRPVCLRFYASQSSAKKSPAKGNPNVEKDEDEDAVAPLSLLQRPLGVLDPPTTVAKTSKETLNEMMDQKKRMEHRKHLYVPFLAAAKNLSERRIQNQRGGQRILLRSQCYATTRRENVDCADSYDTGRRRRSYPQSHVKAHVHVQKSLYFPNVLGSALDGSGKKHTTDICKGRISIISMLSSKISEVRP